MGRSVLVLVVLVKLASNDGSSVLVVKVVVAAVGWDVTVLASNSASWLDVDSKEEPPKVPTKTPIKMAATTRKPTIL
jgi:hypothetical protein